MLRVLVGCLALVVLVRGPSCGASGASILDGRPALSGRGGLVGARWGRVEVPGSRATGPGAGGCSRGCAPSVLWCEIPALGLRGGGLDNDVAMGGGDAMDVDAASKQPNRGVRAPARRVGAVLRVVLTRKVLASPVADD